MGLLDYDSWSNAIRSMPNTIGNPQAAAKDAYGLATGLLGTTNRAVTSLASQQAHGSSKKLWGLFDAKSGELITWSNSKAPIKKSASEAERFSDYYPNGVRVGVIDKPAMEYAAPSAEKVLNKMEGGYGIFGSTKPPFNYQLNYGGPNSFRVFDDGANLGNMTRDEALQFLVNKTGKPW